MNPHPIPKLPPKPTIKKALPKLPPKPLPNTPNKPTTPTTTENATNIIDTKNEELKIENQNQCNETTNNKSPHTSLEIEAPPSPQSKKEEKRKNLELIQVLEAMIEKEENLICTLEEIISQFKDPIEGEEIFAENELNIIFGNLEEFLGFHKQFRNHLSINHKSLKSNPSNEQEVLLKFIHFFEIKHDVPYSQEPKSMQQVYNSYFQSRMQSHELINKALNNNKEFIKFLEQVKSTTGNKIEALLNIPLLYWHTQMKSITVKNFFFHLFLKILKNIFFLLWKID